MEELIKLLTGNIGSALILFLLWKSGMLKDLGLLKNTNAKREVESNDFHLDIARELGGINEKMKALPKAEKEITRLADHVAVQNGRVGKLERKVDKLENK